MYTWRIGFLAIARRWWAVVALATVAGGLLAYQYGSSVAPTYEAEAQLLVSVRGGNLEHGRLAVELAPTFAELVRSTPVLQGTIDSLGLQRTPDDLRPKVRGESDRETRLLTIRARDRDAKLAVAIANALAAELTRFVSEPSQASETDESASSAVRPAELRLVEPATEADKVRPQPRLLLWFGALTGCFMSVAVAMIVESLRRTVRSEEDLTRLGPHREPGLRLGADRAAHRPRRSR
jgi:capsular polysaccharide biosynthesis protein